MNRPKLSALLAGILLAAATGVVGLLALTLSILWLSTGHALTAQFLIWIYWPLLILLLLGSAVLGLWRSHTLYRRHLDRRYREATS